MSIEDIQSKVRAALSEGQQIMTRLRADYAASDNLTSFVRKAVTEEILNKKERIPGTLITLWVIAVFILSYDWTFGMNWAMVFNLVILPVLVYYIVQTVREAPSN